MEETRANPKNAPPPAPAAQVKNRAEVMARVQWGIGLAITAAVAVLWWAGLMQRFEFPLVDEYMRRFYSAAPPPANDLCIIAIDDDSLEKTKRWPWPRDMQARVIDELKRAGAKVVALDLLLNNPEPGPRFETRPDITRLPGQIGMMPPGKPWTFVGPPSPDEMDLLRAVPVNEVRPDAMFAESMARHGMVVLGAEFPFMRSDDALRAAKESKNVPFSTVFEAVKKRPGSSLDDLRALIKDEEERKSGSGARIEDLERKRLGIRTLIERRERYSIPLPPSAITWLESNAPELPAAGLFEASALIGSVTATGINDTDGVLRRMPLWVRHDDRLYPSLGLAAAAAFLDVPIEKVHIDGRFTVVPTARGVIRLEMHTADLAGHPDVQGLVYLAWPTGKAAHKQFSPNKHETGAADGRQDPHASASPGPKSPSAAESKSGELGGFKPGEEVPIGIVYEPALVEGRIKQNIEQTDRAMLRISQLYKLGFIDEKEAAFVERSNRLLTLGSDDPNWVPLLELHAKQYAKARENAVYSREQLSSLRADELTQNEKDQIFYCDEFLAAIGDIESSIRGGIDRIRQIRDALRQRLAGKLCLIGWVAVGSIADFVPTSIDIKTPGPYLHAAVANSILTGHQKLISTPAITGVGLGSIILMGVIGTMLGIRIGVLVSPLALVGSMAVWALMAGYIVFDRWNAVTAFASPIAAAGVSWLGVTLHRLLVEQRGRKQTEARFRSYVSPDVVDILVNNPDLQSMAPQKRELTIMFSDVANWTTLTERLGTEGIFLFLSKYLGEMTDIIQKNKATLDKYLGDGIMAFWGAPIEDPDHAKNASIACVEMLERLGEMNRTNAFGDAGTVEVRFGIATGEVNVGDFGNPPHKSAYTVIGDAVNLAARLESSNKQFGTSILMTKRVVDLSGSTLLFRPIGRIVVKGKIEYDELYELIGDRRPKGERTLEWIKATNDAVAAYQAGRLDEAAELFSTLDSAFGDSKLAKLYLHAIEDLKASGIPEGWEGTLVLTEK